jgi:hypothetical protein
MGNSNDSGSGNESLPQIGEIYERVLTIEEAVRKMKDDIPRIAGTITLPVQAMIRIIDDTSGPPGRVMIHPDDEVTDISLGNTVSVVKLPIGPFKTLHEEPLPINGEVQFNLNKKLNTSDPNAAFTFDYAVDPTGNGGGPNIIVRP